MAMHPKMITLFGRFFTLVYPVEKSRDLNFPSLTNKSFVYRHPIKLTFYEYSYSRIPSEIYYTKTPKVFTPKVFISEVFTKYLPPKKLASVHFSKLFMRGCVIDRFFARFFKEKQSNIAKMGPKKQKSVDSPKFKLTKLEESIKSYEALVIEANNKKTKSKISSFFQLQNE